MRNNFGNGMQYVGNAGVTSSCVEAVVRFIQCREKITRCRILTVGNSHALLLTLDSKQLVAVKTGFTSGYLGEGPKGLSYTLRLLELSDCRISEYEVGKELHDRINSCSMSESDLKSIEKLTPCDASSWYAYILDKDFDESKNGLLWSKFQLVIPFGIIDSRIIDLAIDFWESPDAKLMSAYRRLEGIFKNRTGLNQCGAKLFSEAFLGKSALLMWPGIEAGELVSRVNLFTGLYGAYRNPRAHNEQCSAIEFDLLELLAVNQLYRLEALAIDVQESD
ncbi:TIGR02391 family protein [uncultured Rubinisphaera sp.]|uniref:TIGR02391 family protein n=1 Tax=uncultured Rubinisphaera sp. TaxID=1678686 RepID=UPI0030D88A68